MLKLLVMGAATTAPASLPAGLVGESPVPPSQVSQSQKPAYERQAYFGELHLHTTMSFDAWAFGTRVTPDQAYKFARGDLVMVPAGQVATQQGLTVTGLVPARRLWPLDFAAVTDHSEYLGAMTQLEDPNSAFSKTDVGEWLSEDGWRTYQATRLLHAEGGGEAPVEMRDAARASHGWDTEIDAANANYQPGRFTTFIAYEWTASPGQNIHMHRNVIFNSDHAPTPFTAVDSNRPEDLWKYLESVRARGIDVIAIPHNSNFSDGRDFDWNMSNGRPIDETYAQERAINEPLIEMAQTKGSSETTPELSPTDEFANFAIMDRVYKGETKSHQHGSYVREGLGRGLIIQSRVGVNPFKLGFEGGSDIHNGLSVSYQNGYAGTISGLDPKTMMPTGRAASRALGSSYAPAKAWPWGPRPSDPQEYNPGAITGVWAEENTRNAIFAALKRRETFATSGTRIRVRMFAGWGYASNVLDQPTWAKIAYAEGVPMGSDMPSRPIGAGAPRFLVQASKDPDGANLDRVQIIKIWLDRGDYREKIFDVALSGDRRVDRRTGRAPDVGNTVDLTTGQYTNTIGAATLSSEWRDPEFDPQEPAVYYVRVLEIPTPRWTTLLAIHNRMPLPDRSPQTSQERAWGSPIWYTPARQAALSH